jgi:hypothetical protein
MNITLFSINKLDCWIEFYANCICETAKLDHIFSYPEISSFLFKTHPEFTLSSLIPFHNRNKSRRNHSGITILNIFCD